MPKARKSQISLLDTSYYHCVSRCVGRASLCGEEGGKSFKHRRQWVEDRIHTLRILMCACLFKLLFITAIPYRIRLGLVAVLTKLCLYVVNI